MAVLVFASDEENANRILNAVEVSAVRAANWSAFRDHSDRATVCVLAVGAPEVSDLSIRIQELRRWTANAPVILILDWTPPNGRLLARVFVEGVVWTHEIESHLYAAVTGCMRMTLQARFASAVRNMQGSDAESRNRIAILCETQPPPNNVKGAAGILAESVPRARVLIKGVFGDEISLERLLEWLRLMWACDPSRGNRKEHAVARQLGRHDRTLRRNSAKLTTRPLRELRSDPEFLIHSAFLAFRLHNDVG